ncbi:hypothetical protein JCM12296A_53360 [Desulfosarcina cetonica]|uniref:hypothetical protein n=1 Tax=Desulfosarcina cetonica TaxID=90730 RepID=UPI0006D14D43|nr:hypothetical protein [Desulfosarcina cetonica]
MTNIYKIHNELIVHDPTHDQLTLLQNIDPGFRVESIRPGSGFVPRFQDLRRQRITLDRPAFDFDIPELLSAIEQSDKSVHCHECDPDKIHEYSALGILFVIACKRLIDCTLCGRQCNINRYEKAGQCGLTTTPFNIDPFIHIAEEAPINPAFVISYSGCGMGCVSCIERALYKSSDYLKTDHKAFWERYARLKQEHDINTVEFSNLTESVHSVLDILSAAPMDMNLPIVANVHLYSGKPLYEIALRFVDVWLVDFRYGNDECAKRLSGIDNYMEYARLGMDQIKGFGSRSIVRILVLPNHLDCCLKPIVDILSEYKDRIWVSILGQYIPEHNAHRFEDINRRPTVEEIRALEEYSRKRGLRLVDSVHADRFWE